jgi:hypothetical protein
LSLALVPVALADVSLAQDDKKVAQTGMQFLSVVSDARAAALANTVTAIEQGSEALFFNPSTMAFADTKIDASFSLNSWIADIDHINTSLAYRPGNIGTFGFSVQAVDYGVIEGTIVAANEQGYEDTGIIEPTALAIGAGFARALSDRFAVGGQVKWVQQDLGASTISGSGPNSVMSVDNSQSVIAFDFGTLYRTAFHDLTRVFNYR